MPEEQTLYRSLRSRLREYRALRSAYHLLLAVTIALQDSSRRSRVELDCLFSRREDPWNYTRKFERRRHAVELEMLDAVAGTNKFATALELGCAEGAFTERLALKCATLVAVDISEFALQRAMHRCARNPNVRVERWDVRQWPRGMRNTCDLIVAIHVLEYVRSPFSLNRIRRNMVESLRIGGYLLVGNVYEQSVSETSWWGKYLLHGGNWINEFISRHPALKVIASRETDLGDCRSRDVLLRRIA